MSIASSRDNQYKYHICILRHEEINNPKRINMNEICLLYYTIKIQIVNINNICIAIFIHSPRRQTGRYICGKLMDRLKSCSFRDYSRAPSNSNTILPTQ